MACSGGCDCSRHSPSRIALRLVSWENGLDDFRYLHSTRAELLRRLGRTDEARDAYRRARQLTDDGAERRFLERRLTELAGTSGMA
jgi:RNA polymerase sigma-70 factor (ECF subfamily)